MKHKTEDARRGDVELNLLHSKRRHAIIAAGKMNAPA